MDTSQSGPSDPRAIRAHGFRLVGRATFLVALAASALAALLGWAAATATSAGRHAALEGALLAERAHSVRTAPPAPSPSPLPAPKPRIVYVYIQGPAAAVPPRLVTSQPAATTRTAKPPAPAPAPQPSPVATSGGS